MRPEELRALLGEIRAGSRSVEETAEALQRLPVDDLGFAQLDLHRELRQGLPEAIYGGSKTAEQVVTIAGRLLEVSDSPVIATRVSAEAGSALTARFPDAIHHEAARLVIVRPSRVKVDASVMVACAGTSDLPIAQEAAMTAEALGLSIDLLTDVGVSGPHRLLNAQSRLRAADVVIVVAGMDGALPSLVGGLVSAPVIAVPTSVGYGASFDGLAALLTMLNSCSAGVTVTNIDNGFGAACAAVRIFGGRGTR